MNGSIKGKDTQKLTEFVTGRDVDERYFYYSFPAMLETATAI